MTDRWKRHARMWTYYKGDLRELEIVLLPEDDIDPENPAAYFLQVENFGECVRNYTRMSNDSEKYISLRPLYRVIKEYHEKHGL